jgi:hypothetical protein
MKFFDTELIGILLQIALVLGAGYVLAHFLLKFW